MKPNLLIVNIQSEPSNKLFCPIYSLLIIKFRIKTILEQYREYNKEGSIIAQLPAKYEY